MVVVGRLAADVGVLAARQVDALDRAEIREDLERPEDRRPADAEVPGPGRATRSAAVKWPVCSAMRRATARRGSVRR